MFSKMYVVVGACAALAAAAAVAIVFSSGSVARKDNEVLVLCGGSMRGALERIKKEYEKTTSDVIVTTYGGSGELCAQIQETGRGDIYLCHDPFMPWAEERGLIVDWDTVASLRVAIIVPKGNPKGVKGLEDLAKPGLRLGIGNQVYSTSGQITKHLFATLPYGKKVLANVRVETKGHQQRCNDVVMGTIDASIVWGAVAELYTDRLEIIPIPMDNVDAITSATYKKTDVRHVKVTAGIIKGARDRPAVRRFQDYLTGDGAKIFAEMGFGPAEREVKAP
jgi:molybdate transport system substrate-binding protein